MEHRDDHRPLDGGPTRRARLSSTHWGLIAGVVLLLLALELFLLYAYMGIGRASDRYEGKGESATLMANVQRESMRLVLRTNERELRSDALVTQRGVLENVLGVASAAATNDETIDCLQRIRQLLPGYDKALARARTGDARALRRLETVVERLELEAKRAYDKAELGFYESTSQALTTQKRAQGFLLGMGALLLLLSLPLAISLRRVFDTELKRLSAFPRLSPFPVVELAPKEVRYANAATESLAREHASSEIDGLLPRDWPTRIEALLSDPAAQTSSHEVEVAGRTIAWSFFPAVSSGVVHGYGMDVTERRRAENALLQQSRIREHQANHDALTGLGNRRKLMEDAERRVPHTSAEVPLVLAIFDLDGFKSYNDTFGHPAGDALLARLGERLKDSLPGEAAAYRMGGDEFCLLADSADPTQVIAEALEALHEEGESFVVSASVGFAQIPTEAENIVHALQLADQRLYANKRSSRASAGAQARDALLQVLAEQHPDLAPHVDSVAELAAITAGFLGLEADEVARVRLAAELHDIGKSAIPGTILDKPGPLDPHEWQFVKQHTVIGDRILAAAPALANIASVVRSSHERIDGTGYPDRLAGGDIPLAARIVAIADAFDAMVRPRPYRDAMTLEAALTELRKCAGTQFDPDVVEAFVAVIKGRELRAA
jgi:diguanylate cyclase (GGDEF)-like protein